MENLEYYLDKAKENMESKKLLPFIENITLAKSLVKPDSEIYSKIIYQYAMGLYEFGEYEDAYNKIVEALEVVSRERKEELEKVKGIIFAKLGNLKVAIQIFKRLSLDAENKNVRYLSVNNLAGSYIYMYKRDKEQSYLDKAIEQCTNFLDNESIKPDKVIKKKVLDNLGTAYWYKDDFQKALKAFTKALDFVDSDPKLYNNLAFTYLKLGDIDQAIKYIDKAEVSADRTKNIFEKAQTYSILAELSETKQDYSTAIDYNLVALDNFIQVQAPIETYECWDNILRLQVKINRESIDIMKQRVKEKSLLNFEENFSSKLK